MSTNTGRAVQTLREIVTSGAAWVLFEQGTCIFLGETADLEGAAKSLLREHGPIQAGGPGGDFGVMTLPAGLGWIVSYDFPDMLTLVLPQEAEQDAEDVAIGLLGRGKRAQDAEELHVVHVEPKATLP